MAKKSKQKVLVLGHFGQLGHMVHQYLGEQFAVQSVDERFDIGQPEKFLDAVGRTRSDVVVNAIGAIKQRAIDPSSQVTTNAFLPALLRQSLPRDTLLVHPSTDCVYDGLEGPYRIDHPYTAKDPYGISKSLSEAVLRHPHTLVVRCSIVGPEISSKPYGLLGWFLAQPQHATVNGYADHLWNGITTLEWARIVAQAIGRPDAYGGGSIIQPGTADKHSKFDMLTLFAEIFRPDMTVKRQETGLLLDRSLVPTLIAPPLREQLLTLKAYMARGAASLKAG